MSPAPCTAHDHAVMCRLPKTTKSKRSLSKERRGRPGAVWGRGHHSRDWLSPRVPVPSGHSGSSPHPTPTPPKPDAAGQRLLSTDRQPLLSQDVCFLFTSILGAWTQPWNFRSLEETSRARAPSSPRASLPHDAPVLCIRKTEGPMPREQQATVGKPAPQAGISERWVSRDCSVPRRKLAVFDPPEGPQGRGRLNTL